MRIEKPRSHIDIRERVIRVYHGDEIKASQFLESQHSLLGGKSPLDLATSSRAGADAVRALLDGAEASFPV